MRMNFKIFLCAAVFVALPLSAQLTPTNSEGVAMGHFHLTTPDVDAQKAFWIGTLGGVLLRAGTQEFIEFPGVYIMLRKGQPTGPPAGSVVNHFGFVVKDMPASLAKWKAANVEIQPTENPNEVYVEGPDGIRVEVYGVPDLPTPVQMNHIHYQVPAAEIPKMQAWYAKVFGATPGTRACVACVSKPATIQTGNLPGMNLSFAASPNNEVQAPTKGRSLDHIGFDVKDIDAFAKHVEGVGEKLEAPGVRVSGNGLTKYAYMTDPWGTYIEITQGMIYPGLTRVEAK
jgi:predicted enzyme related to lactoylglutathione lyase